MFVSLSLRQASETKVSGEVSLVLSILADDALASAHVMLLCWHQAPSIQQGSSPRGTQGLHNAVKSLSIMQHCRTAAAKGTEKTAAHLHQLFPLQFYTAEERVIKNEQILQKRRARAHTY